MGRLVNDVVEIGTFGLIEDVTGQEAAQKASREAAGQAAAGQREALAYLKQREALPTAFREAALTDVGAELGYTLDEQGNVISSGLTALERARQSPIYDAILGTREAGEQAIARTASATGDLRSGATIGELTDYNQQLEQQASLTAYQDEQAKKNILLGQYGYAPQIANLHSGIGQTQAQGTLGAAQAQQAVTGQLLGLTGQVGSAEIMALSDIRLKENIEQIGNTSHHGIKTYKWDWKEESGKEGSETGYLAQEVIAYFPDLVAEGNDGYLRINKSELEARLNV